MTVYDIRFPLFLSRLSVPQRTRQQTIRFKIEPSFAKQAYYLSVTACLSYCTTTGKAQPAVAVVMLETSVGPGGFSGGNAGVRAELDPLWLAQSKYKRRRFQECVEICTEQLHRNPYDESFWYLKCRALTAIDWLDDIELEDDTLADQMLDENSIAQMPRPGTSMNRPATGAANNQSQLRTRTGRPISSSGRPVSGFARPSSSALRPGTTLERALQTASSKRGTTARPVTGSGRFVRLGTASMLDHCGDTFIDSNKIDLRKYAKKTGKFSFQCNLIITTITLMTSEADLEFLSFSP